LTSRKAVDLVRYNRTKKRTARSESSRATNERPDMAELAEVIDKTPTPEFALMAAEELRRLLDLLGDRNLEALAVMKMEGRKNSEIADRQGCSPRTIERRLELVRKKWTNELKE
jgi:RNA polymerase sigma factor (sigma-70 family)